MYCTTYDTFPTILFQHHDIPPTTTRLVFSILLGTFSQTSITTPHCIARNNTTPPHQQAVSDTQPSSSHNSRTNPSPRKDTAQHPTRESAYNGRTKPSPSSASPTSHRHNSSATLSPPARAQTTLHATCKPALHGKKAPRASSRRRGCTSASRWRPRIARPRTVGWRAFRSRRLF